MSYADPPPLLTLTSRYDLSGAKLVRRARKDKLEQLLDRNDSKKALRTIYDEYNDEEITLSKEELRMVGVPGGGGLCVCACACAYVRVWGGEG